MTDLIPYIPQLIPFVLQWASDTLPEPLRAVEPLPLLIGCAVGYVITSLASRFLRGVLMLGMAVAVLRLLIAARPPSI